MVHSTFENPKNIKYTKPGPHLIRFTISENGCVKHRTDAIRVLADPRAKVLISDSIGCQPMTVTFRSLADSNHAAVNFWTINNLNFTDTCVVTTYSAIGAYSYSLVVKDKNNCTDTILKKNFIKVNATPLAKFFTSSHYAGMADPRITFIDSTKEVHFTKYMFGDGSVSTQINTIYNYKAPGNYRYQLVAFTEFGCADTLVGDILIDDIKKDFVPNIFTPNNDGTNDNFFIVGDNITKSEMKIFNRWGGLVFESENAVKGWNGIEKNTGQACADGTYFYNIKMTLDDSRNYEFKGSLQLAR